MSDATLQDLLLKFDVGVLLTRGILVVDDEPANLDVLRSFLEDSWTVYEAHSGDEALAMCADLALDVVLTDQRMPGLTGVELLEQLRALRPDVVGIVLTGYSDTPELLSAINRAGVFRYLKKPWQPEEILTAVDQAADHVAQQRAIRRLVEILAARTDELGVALDSLRTAQQALLQMERLVTTGRLAAGIAHDLRNAMTGLIFLEREASTRHVGGDFLEVVQVGLAGVRNLLDSLDTMNQFVRKKRLSMAMEFFDPSQVVRDAVAVMRMDLGFRARDVQIDAPSGVLPPLLGDRQKLVQVLVNLLRNATQATSPQQRVNISVGSAAQSNEIVFAVEDDGSGVPAEVRDQLFDAFVSSKGEQGMGMGLYMARLIVKNHRGQIQLVDRPGGGTRFEIVLPAASAPIA